MFFQKHIHVRIICMSEIYECVMHFYASIICMSEIYPCQKCIHAGKNAC